MSSHNRNLTHVITDSVNIKEMHDSAPSTGMIGPPATLNGRCASGRFMRSTITATETTTNANSVPMLVISPTTWIGMNPAAIATMTHVMIVVMYGVLNRGWTL